MSVDILKEQSITDPSVPASPDSLYILVVERDSLARELFDNNQLRQGSTITSVSNGREAINYYKSHKDINAVILDGEPVPTRGAKLAEALRSEGCTGTIVMTYCGPQHIRRTDTALISRSGVNAIVEKAAALFDPEGVIRFASPVIAEAPRPYQIGA